jgi:hypothetical protein
LRPEVVKKPEVDAFLQEEPHCEGACGSANRVCDFGLRAFLT